MNFKKQLAEQGINVVVRKNDRGRIYGMTFIDHNSKTVWNGSRLSKELSANTFNDYWNNNIKSEFKEPAELRSKISLAKDLEDLPDEKPHHLFDFLNSTQQEGSWIEGLGGLLIPETQGEDYEEQDFARKMKKKKTFEIVITNKNILFTLVKRLSKF